MFRHVARFLCAQSDRRDTISQHIPPAESDNAAGQSEAKGEKEMDQDSGKRTPVRYFYNSKTKTSCWTRPPGARDMWGQRHWQGSADKTPLHRCRL